MPEGHDPRHPDQPYDPDERVRLGDVIDLLHTVTHSPESADAVLRLIAGRSAPGQGQEESREESGSMTGANPWQRDIDKGRVVVWQCLEHPKHRGWRDESQPAEVGKRGTCDTCLGRTAFEVECVASGSRHPRGGPDQSERIDHMNDDEPKVTKKVEVSVRDARGKTYKFELGELGVKITPPTSLKTAPIALADLRRVLSELEAAAGA